jgi:biopolymer transport protein ExbB/TolQ
MGNSVRGLSWRWLFYPLFALAFSLLVLSERTYSFFLSEVLPRAFIGAALAGVFIALVWLSFLIHENLRSPNVTTHAFFWLGAILLMLCLLMQVPSVQLITLQLLLDTTWISQTILLIFLAGLSADVVQLWQLRKEDGVFQNIRKILKAHSVRPPTQEFLNQLLPYRDSLTYKKIRLLLTQHARGGAFDFKSLMGFSNQSELNRMSKLNYVAKILPVLGLVGTVVGFTLSIIGMQDSAQAIADFTRFKNSMIEALEGMKTAFQTTLIGMVTMGIIIFLNLLVSESRNRLLRSVDEMLYTEIFTFLTKGTTEDE